ncbi:MAG: metallophosphoesterase [Phycisphaerales bacterium]
MGQNEHPSRFRRLLTRLAALAAVWAVLTLMASAVHWQVWGHGTGEAPTGPVLVAGNLVHAMSAPAWFGLRIATGRWGLGSYVFLLAVDGIACAMWMYILFLAFRLRTAGLRWWERRLLRRADPAAPAPVDMSRRRLLVDGSLAVAGVGLAGVGVGSAAVEPFSLRLRSYTVPIAGLPESLDRLRLVHISDTHLGPRMPASFIREVVQRALSLNPDLVVLTGDYIHTGSRYIEPAAALFSPLTRSGVPVAGVLGNHDWYGNGRAMSAALTAIGVRMVDNGRAFLDARTRQWAEGCEPGRTLCVAGVGDLVMDFISLNLAVGGVPPEVPRVLLAHQPDTAEMRQCVGLVGIPAPRIDLMLAGHTHGGQIRLPLIGTPFIPSRYGQKYAGGLVQGPKFPVVVSRGVGMSMVPIRRGVPPELVEVMLTRA